MTKRDPMAGSTPPPPPAGVPAAPPGGANMPGNVVSAGNVVPPSPGDAPPAASSPGAPPASDIPADEPTLLEQFLQRAGSIIAMERGINARSRIKLQVIARDMGLPPEEFEAAMQSLQSGGDKKEPNAEQIQAFRLTVLKQLEKLPRAVLTPDLETKAAQFGVDRYQLTLEQAQKVVREAAAEKKIQRITPAEAERYVGDLIAKKLSGNTWIDLESADRIRSAGQQWGLKAEQVDDLIRLHTEANFKRHQSKRQFATYAIAGGGGLVVLLLCAIGYFVLLGDSSSGALPEEGPAPVAPPPVVKVERNTWWSHELSGDAGVLNRTAGFKPIFQQISAADPNLRATGYEAMFTFLLQQKVDASVRHYAQKVIGGCLAAEPDPEAATALVTSLLDRLLIDRTQPPTTGAAYDQAYWTLQTALTILQQGTLPAERAQQLAEGLQSRLSVALDPADITTEARDACFKSLSTQLYQQLVNAASNGADVGSLQQSLARFAARGISVEQLQQFNAQFLSSVLSRPGVAWRKYEPLLAETVKSNDRLVAAQLLDIYERTQDTSLEEFLDDKLMLAAGAVPNSDDKEGISKAVRQALGLEARPTLQTAEQRWGKIRADAREAVIKQAIFSPDPVALLQDTVDAARLATLACALAQQEPGYPLFDELLAKEPLTLNSSPATAAAEPEDFRPTVSRSTNPAAQAAAEEDLQEQLDILKFFGSHHFSKRISAMMGISRVAPKIQELRPEQAAIIANYLLTDDKKSTGEFDNVATPVSQIRQWRQLRMAIADNVIRASQTDKVLQTIVNTLLRSSSDFEPGRAGRLKMREMLLRSVLEELSNERPDVAVAGNAAVYDAAGAEMLEQYRSRAQLLGASPTDYRSLQTMSQALRLLISLTASKAQPQQAGDKAFVASLAQQLQAVDYVAAGNELRRAVMLQRIWLRLLALQPTALESDKSRTIIDKVVGRDVAATNLLHQLKDGETSILQMYMLHD
ncbi:hypothetical protein [Lignipirellula cremea]|uniref:Uncharacterized protein n=1 Tax=Lignipirellula cremea TaxID=2528010 RepID=A0A518DST3_9BACT|nr:hypothetical protein [Lignipirellula cremea]QDU94897.1 hypothetical protein Pla8534_27050 [Lignipirellula cremea]